MGGYSPPGYATEYNSMRIQPTGSKKPAPAFDGALKRPNERAVRQHQ